MKTFDSDHDFITSADELHTLLTRTNPDMTKKQSAKLYEDLLEASYDLNGDGKLSVEDIATYYVDQQMKGTPFSLEAVKLDTAESAPGGNILGILSGRVTEMLGPPALAPSAEPAPASDAYVEA